MSYISIYKNAKDSISTDTEHIDNFIHSVKSGRWKEQVEKYRSSGDQSDKEKLPMVTISGQFQRRRADALIKHSGFICVDIDKLPTQEHFLLYQSICEDSYTYACFSSCSGNGIAVIIKIDPARHLDAFAGLEKYYAEKFATIIDRSCKDITRSRFVSYDPHLHHNQKAHIFKKYIPKKEIPKSTPPPVYSTSDFNQIIDHIERNAVDITNSSYHDWYRIGFALADEFKEAGRGYFHTISRFSPKYDEKKADHQYNACLKSRGSGLTISTFFHYCKVAGVPIRSKQTVQAMRVCEQAKKQGRTIESAVKVLTQLNGMDALEASEIAEKAFKREYAPESGNNIVKEIEIYLNSNASLRYNTITQRIENNGTEISDKQINSMYLDMKEIVPKLPLETFKIFINSDRVTPYNPLTEFIESHSDRTPVGSIKEMADCIRGYNGYLPDGEFIPDFIETFLTKFYLGLIAGAFGHKMPPIIPILWGKEIGKGKTWFWSNLLPEDLRERYFQISQMDQGKDDDILLSKKWLVCDDEWGGKFSKDSKFMKTKVGQNSFTVRKAYAREHEEMKRVAMICGTSNERDLIQETNNRRIIPINAQEIDLDRYNAIDKIDPIIEAYHLYTSAGESPFLSQEENKLLNEISKQNTTTDFVQEMIMKFYEPAEDPSDATTILLTATEIHDYITKKMPHSRASVVQVGRTLQRLEFLQHHDGKKRVYLVKSISDTER